MMVCVAVDNACSLDCNFPVTYTQISFRFHFEERLEQLFFFITRDEIAMQKCHSVEAFFLKTGQPNLRITVGNYTNWVCDEWGFPLTAHMQAIGTQFKSYYDTPERGGPFSWRRSPSVIMAKMSCRSQSETQAGGKCWTPTTTTTLA